MKVRHRMAMAVLLCAAVNAAQAQEVRETWDGEGRIVTRQTLQGDRLVQEERFTYDKKGRQIERRQTKDGKVTVDRTEYLSSGKVALTETWVDEKLTGRKRYLYKNGLLLSLIEDSDTAQPVTTTYAYDPYGRVVLTEKRDANGELVARTVADHARPAVPIEFALSAGMNVQSDVDLNEVVLGFSVSRTPVLERYGADPLEARASVTWRRSQQKGEVNNNALKAAVNLDYNYLLPATTLFLFALLESNPVANLNLDLQVAPIGVKFDLVPRKPFIVDLSFAPVWNYRTVSSPIEAGDTCEDLVATHATDCIISTSKARGSFRGRVQYVAPRVTLSETLEYLPNFLPADGEIVTGFTDDAILRSITLIDLKLTERLSLREEFRFTRDQSLSSQADCEADPDDNLCRGHMFSSVTALSFLFGVKR